MKNENLKIYQYDFLFVFYKVETTHWITLNLEKIKQFFVLEHTVTTVNY